MPANESDRPEWTDQDVIAEANKWIWDPPGTVSVEQGSYRLSHRPEGHRSSIVHWSSASSSLEAAALVGEVIEQTKAVGKQRLLWWLRPGDEPPEMDAVLKNQGFELIDETSILALELGDGEQSFLPTEQPPRNIDIHIARDKEALRTFQRISSSVFGHPMPPLNVAEREVGVSQFNSHVLNFVARIDGEPVAVAGLTLVGRVARLWGAGTSVQYRGRGAYRRLVSARLTEAKERGASLALSRARVGTSAPILVRIGFRAVGSDRCYAIDLFSSP